MASAITTSTRSTHPPKYPEMRPSSTPAKIDSSTATMMAMTAVLAPHTVRLNTSNPPTVVPQMCLDEGAACVGNDTPSASLICEYP
jgi:hypothetical protein